MGVGTPPWGVDDAPIGPRYKEHPYHIVYFRYSPTKIHLKLYWVTPNDEEVCEGLLWPNH